MAFRAREDAQDAEIVRLAAYTGLRRGELVALRWRDVDFAGRKITVRRALSGETEVRSTKNRRAREVPLPDQAAAALERVRTCGEFTTPDDHVFANRRQLGAGELRAADRRVFRFACARGRVVGAPLTQSTFVHLSGLVRLSAASALLAKHERGHGSLSLIVQVRVMASRLVVVSVALIRPLWKSSMVRSWWRSGRGGPDVVGRAELLRVVPY